MCCGYHLRDHPAYRSRQDPTRGRSRVLHLEGRAVFVILMGFNDLQSFVTRQGDRPARLVQAYADGRLAAKLRRLLVPFCMLWAFSLSGSPVPTSSRGAFRLAIGNQTRIGPFNAVECGEWVTESAHSAKGYARSCSFGDRCLVTSRHYFDATGGFELGTGSWVAGFASQFLSHGAGAVDRGVIMGADSYVGSACRFVPGSSVGDRVLVAMGAVVTTKIPESDALVAGHPAEVKRVPYDWRGRQLAESLGSHWRRTSAMLCWTAGCVAWPRDARREQLAVLWCFASASRATSRRVTGFHSSQARGNTPLCPAARLRADCPDVASAEGRWYSGVSTGICAIVGSTKGWSCGQRPIALRV